MQAEVKFVIGLLLAVNVQSEDSYRNGIYVKTYSSITEVPTDIPAQAEEVLLYMNDINDVAPGAFSHLTRCRFLSLLDNEITEIRADMWEGLQSLQQLHLNGNNLEALSGGVFQNIPTLNRLGLSRNALRDIQGDTWYGLGTLQWLFLARNKIKEVRGDMWTGLHSLEELLLMENEITTLNPGAFSPLTNLRLLYLYGNEITEISGNMWEGLNNLYILDLKSNQIGDLERGDLDLFSVRKVILYDNDISTIAEDVFDGRGGGSHPGEMLLAISHNPLTCDRRLCWIKQAQRLGWLEMESQTVTCVNQPGKVWEDINLDCRALH